ncbi:MAG TPA: Calx-beta domain-containing protein [Acidimicrobiales bacterium]|nr:Calx-beta domain-containing protein [Acidimicrobiales bacterium]
MRPRSSLSRLRTAALLGVGMAAVPVLGLSLPARAACHAFDVTVQPSSADEGSSLTVTVSRDGSAGASRIDVESVDGTARAGSDYDRVSRRTIEFTDERSQTFQVRTTDDASAEPAETFRLHLSNPAGCNPNPNYDVGPDATVTIAASDQTASTTRAPATTVATTGTTRPAATGSTNTASVPTVLVSPGPTNFPPVTTSSTTPSTIVVAAPDDDGDSKTPIVLGLVVLGAGLAAAGGWWTYRRRVEDPEIY